MRLLTGGRRGHPGQTPEGGRERGRGRRREERGRKRRQGGGKERGREERKGKGRQGQGSRKRKASMGVINATILGGYHMVVHTRSTH